MGRGSLAWLRAARIWRLDRRGGASPTGGDEEELRDSELELARRWPDKWSIFKRVWDARRALGRPDPDDEAGA